MLRWVQPPAAGCTPTGPGVPTPLPDYLDNQDCNRLRRGVPSRYPGGMKNGTTISTLNSDYTVKAGRPVCDYCGAVDGDAHTPACVKKWPRRKEFVVRAPSSRRVQ